MPVKNTTMEAGSGTEARVVALFTWSMLVFPALPVTSMMSRFVKAYGITNGETRVDAVGEPRLALVEPVDGIEITSGAVPGGDVLLAVLVGEYQLWDVWVLPAVVNV
jgi:hypothetical protein